MSQPAEPSRLSRRTFFRLSSGLRAVTAIGVPAGQADAASSADGKNRSTNLAGSGRAAAHGPGRGKPQARRREAGHHDPFGG